MAFEERHYLLRAVVEHYPLALLLLSGFCIGWAFGLSYGWRAAKRLERTLRVNEKLDAALRYTLNPKTKPCRHCEGTGIDIEDV